VLWLLLNCFSFFPLFCSDRYDRREAKGSPFSGIGEEKAKGGAHVRSHTANGGVFVEGRRKNSGKVSSSCVRGEEVFEEEVLLEEVLLFVPVVSIVTVFLFTHTCFSLHVAPLGQ